MNKEDIIRDFIAGKKAITVSESDLQYLVEFDKALDGIKWNSGNSIASNTTKGHIKEAGPVIYLICGKGYKEEKAITFKTKLAFEEPENKLPYIALEDIFDKTDINIEEESLMAILAGE